MNPSLNGKTLLAWGWTPGPSFPKALAEGQRLLAENPDLSPEALRQALEPLRPKELPKVPLRHPDEAAPLAEAIVATTEEELSNLESVRRLMHGMMRIPVVEKGAIMPDACPAGGARAAITVGGSIAAKDAILPSAHSADIACSMYCTLFPVTTGNTPVLMQQLRDATRFGVGGRAPEDRIDHPVLHEPIWDNPFLRGLEDAAARHMGDQGDGNHFAYLGLLDVTPELSRHLQSSGHDLGISGHEGQNLLALVTHHGSRGLGAQLYKRGQEVAEAHVAKVASEVPPSAAWMDATSEIGQRYWEALQYVSRWTLANHQVIHQRFAEKAGLPPLHAFGNEHNFVWKRDDGLYYHGKGATPAWNDDQGRPLLGLIPLNMAEPILITLGSSNERFLGFAPHGAGRNLSRTATLNKFRGPDGKLDQEAMRKSMEATTRGIQVSWYSGRPDLSETPIGYKDASLVIQQIEEFALARVIGKIRPLGCIMAGDPGPQPWQRKKPKDPR